MMLYKTKSVVIEAVQLSAPNTVEDITGGVGDWVVMDHVGKMHILSDLQFRERFELADEGDVPTRFEKERRQGKVGRLRALKHVDGPTEPGEASE